MRSRPPEFDELVGPEVPPAERDRLRNAHELLVQAGAPPELSPALEQIPWPEDALAPLGLSRRSAERGRPWLLIATGAAALLLVGFLIGQQGGSKKESFDVAQTVKMHGTAKAPKALAAIQVGQAGADGNWPMLVSVTNLPSAQKGGYYDLWLSRGGKPLYLCGSFNTRTGVDTAFRLSAAYPLKEIKFDGWIVTLHVDGVAEGRSPVVLTT